MTSAPTPFFVVGAARSGTTMLRLMLTEHSRLHIPPESWFVKDLMDALPLRGVLAPTEVREAAALIARHGRWKEWEIGDDRLRSAVEELREPTLAELVDAVFRLGAGGKPRWGDKTPAYVRDISRLHELFPEARFVHIIRDGRDVCVSLRQTKWRGDVAWTIGRYWSRQVEAGRRQGSALPPGRYLEVAYEDVVRDADTALRAICAFLGEPFEDGMLRFYERAQQRIPARAAEFHRKTARPPRPSDLERWRRELSPLQMVLFEAAAAPTMRRVGQRPRFGPVARLVRPVVAAIAWTAQLTLPLRRRLGLHFPKLRRFA